MSATSNEEETSLESGVLEAIRRLQSRARSLTPLERVKLHCLLYNLKAIRNHANAVPDDSAADDTGTAPYFISLS